MKNMPAPPVWKHRKRQVSKWGTPYSLTVRTAVTVFLLTVFLVPLELKAQDRHKLDSLSQIITQTTDTSVRIDALLNRADLYPPRDFDRAEADIKEAERLAIATGNQQKLGTVYNMWGLAFRMVARHQEAIAQFRKALAIARKANDPEEAGKTEYNIGSEYSLLAMADSTLHYLGNAEHAFENAKDIDPKYLLFVNNVRGILYRRLGKYDESLAEFDKAIDRHRNDTGYVYLASIYSNKANTLSMLNRVDEAIDLQLKSLKVNELNADSLRIINNFHNIGLMFSKLQEYDKAKTYHLQARQFADQLGVKQSVGFYSMELANDYNKLGNPDSARHYYQDALTVSEQLENESTLAVVYQNYGNFLITQGDYTLAEHYLHQALTIFNKLEMKSEIAAANNSLATIKVETGKLDEAAALNAEVERSMNRGELRPMTEAIATSVAIALDEAQGTPDSAIVHYKTQLEQLRRLYQESERVSVLKAENQYQLDKKDLLMEAERNEALQKRRTILVISIAIILLLLALSAIILLRRKQLDERYRAEVQQLAANHRLETAQALRNAEEKERKKIADRLHDEVGGLLSIARLNVDQLETVVNATPEGREKLQTTQKLLGDVSDTVRNISHVLMPATLERSGLKAAVMELIDAINAAGAIKVEEIIDGFADTGNWEPDFSHTVYRIVQEIINNTLKHAGADHLLIQMVELDRSITIYIEDNGKGIGTGHRGDGLGMSLLQNNIAYYDGAIEINGRENEGTFILIELPIRISVTSKKA